MKLYVQSKSADALSALFRLVHSGIAPTVHTDPLFRSSLLEDSS